MCNEGNMNKRKVHINPEYIEFRQGCLDSCESELFNSEILLESRQCFFSESDFKNHRKHLGMYAHRRKRHIRK